MPDQATRRDNIKILNKLAAKYGLESLDRDAGVDAVRLCYRALLLVAHEDKGGCKEDALLLAGVREAYEDFKDRRRAAPCAEADAKDTDGGEAGPSVLAKRLKVKIKFSSKGAMLTYNGSAGSITDPTGCLASNLEKWVMARKEALGFSYFSATCEQSLRSGQTISLDDIYAGVEYEVPASRSPRAHLHIFIEFTLSREIDIEDFKKELTFEGMVPHIFLNMPGRSQRRSLDRSHFYCRAEKKGTVFFFGNYLPWDEWHSKAVANYRPEGKWLDDLWSAHKIPNSIYIKYAEFIAWDFPKRKLCHDAVVQQQTTRRLEAQAERRQKLLEKKHNGVWKSFSELTSWKQSYSELLSRYDILVLRAGSKSGKTEMANAMFGCVWEQLIEDLPAPNLRTFDLGIHDAILFDNVNSAKFILDNRGLLMARNTVHQLSQTATGLFTYCSYLHRVPIIVTMDVEKPWPADSDWLTRIVS